MLEMNIQNYEEQTTLVRLVLLAMTVFSPNLVSLSCALSPTYMQKTCDVAEKAILAKKNLRKKCVNRDKSA